MIRLFYRFALPIILLLALVIKGSGTALWLMNQPSDFAITLGTILFAGVICFGVYGLRLVLRPNLSSIFRR